MLRERIAVALLLIPLLFWIIADGGWLYFLGVAGVLGVAAAEWAVLFRRQGLRPSGPLVIGGVLLLNAARFALGFEAAPILLTALGLASMVWHLIDFERGATTSGTDFAVTLSGIVYLGWIGPYLISLRALPEGLWWVLLALPTIWLADSGAYFVGRAMGRRSMAPRLSPKKTWEGYLAGIAVGGLAGAGLAALWRVGAGEGSALTVARGLTLGVLIGALAPLGDLGVSMIKRQVRVKDTGRLLPGHGGALDRMDTWLWTGALAYYFVAGMAALERAALR